jgi:hypothetical protein
MSNVQNKILRYQRIVIPGAILEMIVSLAGIDTVVMICNVGTNVINCVFIRTRRLAWK